MIIFEVMVIRIQTILVNRNAGKGCREKLFIVSAITQGIKCIVKSHRNCRRSRRKDEV